MESYSIISARSVPSRMELSIAEKSSENSINMTKVNLYAAYEYQKSDIVSDSGDEQLFLPSTPRYTSSSVFIDMKSSDTNDEHFGPSTVRIWVIILASLANLFQTFSLSIWFGIYEPALKAFPEWHKESFNLLPVWKNAMVVILVFPMSIVINKYGLKKSLLCSCVVFTIGASIRCLIVLNYPSMPVLHVASMVMSAGNNVMDPLIVSISAQWFPKNQKILATGFGLNMSLLAIVLSYLIVPRFVNIEDSNDPYGVRFQILALIIVCVGLNIFISIAVYLFFPKKTFPVSYSSKLVMDFHKSAQLLYSLKCLIKNLDVWFVVLAFTLSNVMANPWINLMPSIFSKLHVPAEVIVNCGLFSTVHCFLLTLSISILAELAPPFRKKMALFTGFTSLIFFFCLMALTTFPIDIGPWFVTCLSITVLIAFPYGFCAECVLYEMSVELMIQLPESFVAGYMMFINDLMVGGVYVILYIFPSFGEYCINIGVFVFSLLSLVCLWLTPDPSKLTKKNIFERNIL